MSEIFESGNGLVSKEEWEGKISSIKEKTSKALLDEKTAIEQLSKIISDATFSRANSKFGVMFSGGVDSALIAYLLKNRGHRFTCYTVGFGNSKDVEAAIIASKLIGINLKYKVYTLDEIEPILKEVKRIIPEKDSVNISVASVVFAVVMLAKEDGVNLLFSGLGSEELFAGYQRHELAEDINEECWAGLANMYKRDLIRDSALASELKVGFLTPLLDEKLIPVAMQVPGSLKISGEHKKLILRLTAEQLGLPHEISFRKKIAAQYGSGFDTAIEKLSTKKGFSKKSEYLASLN